jgi:glycosyltransferase involved in cell wall biosynthesis
MNILIDGLYLTNPYLRGIGYYTRIICRAIDQFNVGSIYISISTINRSNISYLKQHLLGIKYKLIILPIPGRLFFLLSKHFDFYLFLKHFFPIDIVHIPYEIYYKTKLKNTMTIHGMAPFVNPQNSAFEINFRNNVIASKKYITKYITVSQKAKDDIIRYLELSDKDIISIPISLEDYFFNKERIEKQTDNLEIICYGAFEKNKNHENLIKALDAICEKKLLKFTLTIIGHDRWGIEEAKGYLQRPYIKNIGYLNHEELIKKILSTASCVIIPSIYEGYGLSIVESLSLGIPVLASNRIYSLDYVNNGYITFNPFSYSDIVNAIMIFNRNRSRFELEARSERDRIRKILNLENMALRLRDAYQNIIQYD